LWRAGRSYALPASPDDINRILKEIGDPAETSGTILRAADRRIESLDDEEFKPRYSKSSMIRQNPTAFRQELDPSAA
jgi:hypothetical protein